MLLGRILYHSTKARQEAAQLGPSSIKHTTLELVEAWVGARDAGALNGIMAFLLDTIPLIWSSTF